MTSRLHLDVETYSEQDLKTGGLYRYAEHPSTELLVVCFGLNDGPVHAWVPRETLPQAIVDAVKAKMDPGAQFFIQLAVPDMLRKWIEQGGEVRAHNAQFERTILNGVAGEKVGFPKLKIEQMVCTAAKAAASALQRALEDATGTLGTFPKLLIGKNTMRQVSKPREPTKSDPSTRFTPELHADKFIILYDYCIDDVKSERGLDIALPDLSPNEQEVYEMDQRINDRGVPVDLPSVENALALIAARKLELANRFRDITGLSPTQTEKFAPWVRANGYPQLLNLQAETVNRAQRDPACPALPKEALLIYSAFNMKAVSKFEAIRGAVCRDSRLRGMFLYYGANTGRWSSLIVQLQNLYRPKIKDADVAIDAFMQRDLDWVRFLYPHLEPLKVLASCIRGVLAASESTDLISLDYAGIESRFTAWLFKEMWKLKAFEDYDKGVGLNAYRLSYGRAFGVPPESVEKDSLEYLIGKVLELAFGFEGGVGACITAAETYGVDLLEMTEAVWPIIPPDVMDKSLWMYDRFGRTVDLAKRTYLGLNSLKELWRIAHPAHVQGWKDMRDAAILAIQNHGKVYQIPSKLIMFRTEQYGAEKWLRMRLPSGRRISYLRPHVHGEGREAAIWYEGIDTDSRIWTDAHTYGGKLTENAAQGGSSDVMRHGARNLEKAGYLPIMTVHDQAVMEMPKGVGTLEEAKRIYTIKPSWADGLPVAAEGWRGKRFRK